MPTIGFIILAAGASTRLGSPKQLLLYKDKTFIRHITEVALASPCEPIIVVLGANAHLFRSEIQQLPIQIVENTQWSQGMGSSIKVGMEALITKWRCAIASSLNPHAVILSLCDQPFVSPQLLEEIIDTYRLTGKPIVASAYEGTLGVPALFDRRFFPQLLAQPSNNGAKSIIHQYPLEVSCVPFPQGGIDIDTPEDYQKFLLSN